MLNLDFKIMLPVIRKAFDAGELQMQKSDTDLCCYTGPCAVGVCMPEEDREGYDYQGTIIDLLENEIVTAPEDQHDDWIDLQHYHDCGNIQHFKEFLVSLEEKYA